MANCTDSLTNLQILAIESYELIGDRIFEILVDSTNGEEYGQDWNGERQLSVQITVLNFLLQFAHDEMMLLRSQDKFDLKVLYEKYKIFCIKDTLACKKFNITPLLAHYGLLPSSFDGINFMGMENGNNIWEID